MSNGPRDRPPGNGGSTSGPEGERQGTGARAISIPAVLAGALGLLYLGMSLSQAWLPAAAFAELLSGIHVISVLATTLGIVGLFDVLLRRRRGLALSLVGSLSFVAIPMGVVLLPALAVTGLPLAGLFAAVRLGRWILPRGTKQVVPTEGRARRCRTETQAVAISAYLLIFNAAVLLTVSPGYGLSSWGGFLLTGAIIVAPWLMIVTPALALLVWKRQPEASMAQRAMLGAGLIVPLAVGMLLAGRIRAPSEIQRKLQCRATMSVLAEALRMYGVSNDGRFPPSAASWNATRSSDPGLISASCPRSRSAGGGYAYNLALRGLRYDAITDPSRVVALFESDAPAEAGGPELLPKRPRHTGGDVYGFADGTVRWVRRDMARELQWEPVLRKPEEGAGGGSRRGDGLE